jgi:hypothetical protein
LPNRGKEGYVMAESAEWITAAATMSAVIVALFVAFLPSFRRRYNKPKLKVDFKNEEPFCRNAILINDAAQIKHYWVRVRISNVGRSVARNCRGKLIRIRDANTMEERKDFDPAILRWVTGQGKPIDLPYKDREYLNILFTRQNDPLHLVIDAEDKEPRAINLFPERKDYILDMIFYADNVESITESFYFKNSKDYNKIELSEYKG